MVQGCEELEGSTERHALAFFTTCHINLTPPKAKQQTATELLDNFPVM